MPTFSGGSSASRRRSTCGSAAPIAGCLPTRLWVSTPGELFVHRNVANLAPPQDANYLSVLQFAVDVLKVKHIMVVGHYGCGGVSAAVDGKRRGLVDHWLHPIREVRTSTVASLTRSRMRVLALDRLCELNVIRQVTNVASDVFVQEAWARGQSLFVHGWVYSLANGLVTDLDVTISSTEDIERLDVAMILLTCLPTCQRSRVARVFNPINDWAALSNASAPEGVKYARSGNCIDRPDTHRQGLPRRIQRYRVTLDGRSGYQGSDLAREARSRRNRRRDHGRRAAAGNARVQRGAPMRGCGGDCRSASRARASIVNAHRV